jgi:hypothetical protein
MAVRHLDDAEAAEFMGLTPEQAAVILPKLPQRYRDMVDTMADAERRLLLWQKGLGPRPTDMIICGGFAHADLPDDDA